MGGSEGMRASERRKGVLFGPKEAARSHFVHKISDVDHFVLSREHFVTIIL